MYVPDSHRVFHGLIQYVDTNSSVALWRPEDFRLQFGVMCTNLGARFIDTFPALRQAAEAGRVPYNLVGDTHLSAEGSHVVAGVLVEEIRARPVR
jgi:hypothetical protein